MHMYLHRTRPKHTYSVAMCASICVIYAIEIIAIKTASKRKSVLLHKCAVSNV